MKECLGVGLRVYDSRSSGSLLIFRSHGVTQEQLTGSNLDLTQALVIGKQLELKFGEDLGLSSGKRWDRRVPLFVGPP